MLIIIISRVGSNEGHVGLKIRLLSQILQKPSVDSRGHSFNSKFTKLYQNVNDQIFLVKFETGSCWVKN